MWLGTITYLDTPKGLKTAFRDTASIIGNCVRGYMKSSAVLCSPYGGVEETQRRVFDVVVSGLPFRFLFSSDKY